MTDIKIILRNYTMTPDRMKEIQNGLWEWLGDINKDNIIIEEEEKKDAVP